MYILQCCQDQWSRLRLEHEIFWDFGVRSSDTDSDNEKVKTSDTDSDMDSDTDKVKTSDSDTDSDTRVRPTLMIESRIYFWKVKFSEIDHFYLVVRILGHNRICNRHRNWHIVLWPCTAQRHQSRIHFRRCNFAHRVLKFKFSVWILMILFII